jgi:hypothetical protein
MGFTVIFAVAKLSGSATLVAVTVTVCGEANEDGAVYSPVGEMLPTAGLIDQTTDGFVAPLSVVANCCVCDVSTAACPGLTESVTVGRSVIAMLPDWVEAETLVAVASTV